MSATGYGGENQHAKQVWLWISEEWLGCPVRSPKAQRPTYSSGEVLALVKIACAPRNGNSGDVRKQSCKAVSRSNRQKGWRHDSQGCPVFRFEGQRGD